MLVTINFLILLYAVSSVTAVPKICFILAWISLGLEVLNLGLRIGKVAGKSKE